MQTPRAWWRAHASHPAVGVGRRLVAGVLLAAVLAFPLALEHGLEQAQVHETIGVVPATLTLTGTSSSQLHLGLLGNIDAPLSKGPVGISARVDGSPETIGDRGVSSYFSSRMLQVYTGLFHDPGPAVRGYVQALERDLRRQVLATEVRYALVGGLLLAGVWTVADRSLRERVTRHRVLALGVGLPLGLLVTSGIAVGQFHAWADPDPAVSARLPLPSLDDTPIRGAVTDSAVLQLAIEGALPKVRLLVDRQDQRTDAYVTRATDQLRADTGAMTGPRDGEVAVMMESDMHCNAAMISLQKEVVSLLDHTFGSGTVSLLAISGDLTTNGTPAEGTCIRAEATIAGDAPVAAVTGNHESEESVAQMKAAGMHVLEGSTEKVGGLDVLGAADPSRTELFGGTSLRGSSTEEDVGRQTYETARTSHPDLVLLHEAYAVQAFLGSGVTDMRAFLDARRSPTVRYDDEVRDLPAGAVFYGHWHRIVEPRVVWNSDGTWTLVMELNTSGGAIADPTLNHFSTPWSQPQQTASFPVVFEDKETRLVTGYQLYSFGIDGTVTVEPRVEVGLPGGRPATG